MYHQPGLLLRNIFTGRNLRLFCKLCPLDVTTSEKDAVAQELRKLAVCYLPFWGHLQGSKKFCLRGTSLVWFSPVCSNVQFHFFFFSISFSISYHRSHFEKPCLSHNSSHPHLLAQHYWLCFVPSLCRTETCCHGLRDCHKLGLEMLLLK